MKVNVVNGKILECDMSSAGITVLRELGLITHHLYCDLKEGDKLSRNIALGKAMINTKIDEVELSQLVDKEVKKYVQMFIEANKLKPENILEVAKDAIFVYNATPKVMSFGDYVRFRCKERYFLMIEFTISDTNRNTVKLYKRFGSINIRGAKLDTEHPAYYLLLALMGAIENKSKTYYSLLKRFIIEIHKSKTNIINSVDNSHIINVFKTISIG